jgi:hypothetical protein
VSSVVDYLVVVGVGGLVGLAELVARYKDAPSQAVRTFSAGFYIGLNALAAGVALALIRVFDWTFGQEGDAVRWVQVLVAAFGSMALFRSSLFVVRVGDQDVGVGPSSLLQIMLFAADRDVDRHQATTRADLVGRVMKDVAFDKAVVALPTLCLNLMQNVPPEEQEDLSSEVKALAAADMAPEDKTLNLGLRLLNTVGAGVLENAVTALGDRIKVPTT